jgi:signal transduction histidine kinase
VKRFTLHTRQRPTNESEILPPLVQTYNRYWNSAIYAMDVIICGLILYYSGPFSNPPFGVGSPFYRYGMSTVFAAAATYRYRGGLLAALGYDLFAIIGMLVPAPGWNPHLAPYTPNTVDIIGSLIDTPILAILVAYMTNLLESYASSRLRERENARTQSAFAHLGETLLRNVGSRQELIKHSIPPIMYKRFDRLIIALVDLTPTPTYNTLPGTLIYSETSPSIEGWPDISTQLIRQVQQTQSQLLTFDADGIARLYLPLRIGEHTQIILGAESRRTTPFSFQHERFLTIAGTQLLVALDNIRLSEQTVELAANAERGRIAREIHDGISQLTYMLSLQAETSEAQVERIAEQLDSAEAEMLVPLQQRLHKLVTTAKQALWETRNYMFSLKPLMSGTTTLTHMLSTQILEFETISDLPTRLSVLGSEGLYSEQYRHSHRYAQVGTAIFRIVQEALTNAYKHAGATQLEVRLHFTLEQIIVDICDNGVNILNSANSEDGTDGRQNRANLQLARADGADDLRIYSGRGVQGMRERTTELSGIFAITAGQDNGMVVHISIPTE